MEPALAGYFVWIEAVVTDHFVPIVVGVLVLGVLYRSWSGPDRTERSDGIFGDWFGDCDGDGGD